MLDWLCCFTVKPITNLSNCAHIALLRSVVKFLSNSPQALSIVLHGNAADGFAPEAIFFRCVTISEWCASH